MYSTVFAHNCVMMSSTKLVTDVFTVTQQATEVKSTHD